MSFFLRPATAVATPAADAKSSTKEEPFSNTLSPTAQMRLVTATRGRKSKSQRTLKGRFDRTWSSQTPLTFAVPRGIDNRPYPVCDTYALSSYPASSSSGATFTAVNFTVNSFGNLSALQALFDQYRIVMIEYWTIPRVTQSGTSGSNLGDLVTVIDYDDSTVLTSFQSALDYQNSIMSNGADGHYRRFKPHAAVAAYSGAFTSYANVESPWIDAASPAVQHYGIKTAWTITDATYYQDAFARVHTEWRNVR